MAYNVFNRSRMPPQMAVPGGSMRMGIIDPYRTAPPQAAVDGVGSIRQGIVNAPTMREALIQQSGPQQSVAEILSEGLPEMAPDLGGATSAASRQRQIADMLLQGAQQQDNTSIAGGLSQLGQAFLARRAGQKANTAEDKQREMASLLLQQAMGEGPESQAARAQLFADNPAALVAQSDAARRQAVEDALMAEQTAYERGRNAKTDEFAERQYLRDERRYETEQERAARLEAEETRRFNATFGLSERSVAAAEEAAASKPTNPAGLTEDQIKLEVDMSNKWAPMQANFADIQQQYSRISVLGAETKPDGTPMDDAQRAVNDLALVVAFTKMLDPGSVAREGEVELTKKSASLLGEANTWLPRLEKGGTLLPAATRQALVDAATDMMPAYEAAYQKLAADNVGRINAYGLDPSRIMLGYEFAEPAPAQTASPGDVAAPPANGGVPPLLARPTPGTVPPIQIRDDDDFDALPSGVEYVGPDGIRRTKP
jgi:hypothetical protein